jgi:hypothetical protein
LSTCIRMCKQAATGLISNCHHMGTPSLGYKLCQPLIRQSRESSIYGREYFRVGLGTSKTTDVVGEGQNKYRNKPTLGTNGTGSRFATTWQALLLWGVELVPESPQELKVRERQAPSEELVDESIEESFPASDPPAIGHSDRVGGPRKTRVKSNAAKRREKTVESS